ncbi:hypothetical protein PYK79_54370, partial [Streptomyces sp. ID05-04B]|uniref:hypothetical protein n=1 Tax=Streptomyces sp. ID05-04B TaxID=3028661 RepID=UPI0029C53786
MPQSLASATDNAPPDGRTEAGRPATVPSRDLLRPRREPADTPPAMGGAFLAAAFPAAAFPARLGDRIR